MVRFRVADAPARGEYLVEAYVPSEGNDAALIAVFNSHGAAEKFASTMDALVRLLDSHIIVPKQRDSQDD